jgi:hypothetical protein
MKLMLSLDLPEDPMLVVVVVSIVVGSTAMLLVRHKTTLDFIVESLFHHK